MNKKGQHHIHFPMTAKKRFLSLAGLIVLLLIAIGAYFFYSGMLFYKSGTVSDSDNIVIELPKLQKNGFTIFIDQKARAIPPEHYVYATEVTPGKHRIIVSAANYWPWNTNLTVSQGEKTTLEPFLIQKNLADKVKVYRVLDDPTTYAQKNAIIQDAMARTSATSSDDTVALDWSTSKLTATWLGRGDPPSFFCDDNDASSTCPITKSVLDIKTASFINAAFYGARTDVVVFGISSGIFAIDIGGGTTTHNLEPIYQGAVTAMALQNGKVYLKDSGAKGNIIEITVPGA